MYIKKMFKNVDIFAIDVEIDNCSNTFLAQVMYTAINSKGGREAGGMVYALYFVLLTLCGDYTLLNVFLAIACDSLDQAAALTEAEEAEKEVQKSPKNFFPHLYLA
jgi:hypothetical protein